MSERSKNKRIAKRRKQANKLSGSMSHALASKGDRRGGKHRWRDHLSSSGAASEVRVIVKDGIEL